MKTQSFPKLLLYVVLCCTLVVGLGLMAGCKGDNGDTGPAGPAGANGTNGTNGATGPAGPVTLTGESCNVCHTTGQLADFAPFHPDKLTQALAVSNIAVSSSATGTPIVTFHVDSGTLQSDGTVTALTPLAGIAQSNFRMYIADLVPAGTVTSPTPSTSPNLAGTLSTAYFENWSAERSTTPGFSLVDNGAGNYTWTATTLWGAPTTTFLNHADVDVTVSTGHTQRVYVRVSNPSSTTYAKGAAGTLDFKVPANGAAATPLTSQRVMVTIQACWKCHSTTLLDAGHGGGYVDTKGCVVCHSPLYASSGVGQQAGFMGSYTQDPDVEPANNYVFTAWIHHIHDAKGSFADVTFPQDIKNCVICHTGTGDMIDNWKNHPTRVACGSCHDNIDFVTGANHAGGAQPTDNFCQGCHAPSGTGGVGTSVTTAHDTTPTGMNVPEFDVVLSMSPTPTTGFYNAGDVVTVTATLNSHSTGSAVSSSVYTAPKDAAGVSGGGLAVASLYLYGPRSLALPLTGTQANSLFTGSTNTNVITDSTGFKYRLVIPATATPGTYMARFRAADYSRISDTNYVIESTAFQNFQIGTATVQKKIDGDMCVNCHGNVTLSAHDARHAVVFNSDECVSCHDLSGGHADPLANRVHAIHAETVNSDLAVIDWSAVTYPQGSTGPTTTANSTGAKICVGCHTSGNTVYKTNALGEACYGCHGDNASVVNHMLQNGGPVQQ